MNIAARIALLSGLALVRCLSSAQQPAPQETFQPPQAAQPQPDSSLQKLANDYFAGYSHKDLNAIMDLWDAHAPDRDSQASKIHTWFVAASALAFSDLSVNYLEVTPTNARLTIRMRVKAANEPSPEPRLVIHTLTCVRQEKGKPWKISADTDEIDSLAAALLDAKTEADRSALLAKNPELVSSALIVTFIARIQVIEDKGTYDQAFAAATLAKQIAESIHDQIGVGQAFMEFGFIQQAHAKYDDARVSYQQVTAIGDATHNQWLTAAALGSTGQVFRRQGKLHDALDYTLRCLPIFEALGDEEKVSYRLSDAGMTYLRLGDVDSAAKYLQQSSALFEQHNDRHGIGFISQNLGILYVESNDLARALEYDKKALAIYEEMGLRQFFPSLLDNIGNVYQTQNDYAQALTYYDRSLILVRQNKDPEVEASILQNMGGVYTRMRKFETALQYVSQSQAIYERAGAKDGIADCLASRGDILEKMGQHSLAREQFVKSLAITEEIGQQERISESLGALANNDNEQGNPTRALESSTRACAIAQQTNSREMIAFCHIVMGRSFRLLHQPEQARHAFADAIAAVESMRKDVAGGAQQQQSFLESGNSNPYQDMAELLVDEKQPAQAFQYAEKEKARALLDLVQSGHEKLDKVLTAADRESEQGLEFQLVSLNSQMQHATSEAQAADLQSQRDKLRLQLDDFETGLYTRYPELTVQRGETPPITVDEASTLPFDDKTALLEFMVGEHETVLLVLTRDPAASGLAVSGYRIDVKGEDLETKVREFRDQMAGRQLGFQASASRLYNLLLQPAAAQLKNKTALIIVPNDVLWNLPFQALLDPARHYVLEKYAVAYAPSLTVMREMMRQRKPAQNTELRVLAMANPPLPKQTVEAGETARSGDLLSPLPNAEAEVKALAQLYGPDHSRVYTGDQATESRFKAEAAGYNVLHLATHGFMSDSSPMYSSVLLAGSGANDDGLLEAREIVNLDLHADVVVLSACETARGHIGQGEGMIGLTWAFFAAGVPTTVASQWKVDSASTTKLMLAFHRSLKQEHGSALATARSLQAAAMKLLHDPQYAHPFYWAGFVVVGNPN
jgi:CHAT domain-containing protein